MLDHMKRIIIYLLCVVFLLGCGSAGKYMLPSNKVINDFEEQKKACGGDKLSGGFIFGPAIIVLPIIGIVASVRHIQKKNFQECMEKAGYSCVEDCPK